MSRELKFRAYLKQEKEMREVFSFCDKFIKVIVGIGTAWKLPISDFEPIMQFTGLKDKNGVDIYEGDIVYIAGQGNALMEFPFFDIYERIYSGDSSDIENILGNIYENPELCT